MTEIAKMLVLSTAHLTQHVATAWLMQCGAGFSVYDKPDHGWFVYVPTKPSACEGDYPRCLTDCWALARQEGCLWIMFDCDGDIVDNLPTYDW